MKATVLNLGAVVFCSGVMMSGCGSSGQAQAKSGRTYTQPPEYVLAATDLHVAVAEGDPRVTRYADLLHEIRSKCSNQPQEISDVALDVLATLQRKGVEVDLYELMSRINEAMPISNGGPLYDFKEIAAAFKVLGAS